LKGPSEAAEGAAAIRRASLQGNIYSVSGKALLGLAPI